ncbi:hypothetical protein TNCV_3363921 [Trichonephila clavipes]|nr:hypothetical protein TNCV_3363921 [Trichonephila clavipes]
MAPNMKFRCIQPSSEQLYSNSSAVVFDNRCEVTQEENSSILVQCTEWEYDTSSTSNTIVSEVSFVLNFSDAIYIQGDYKETLPTSALLAPVLFNRSR